MVCCIATDKQRRVKVQLSLPQPTKQISKTIHVSTRTVQQYSKNLHNFGSLTPPRNDALGQPHVITPEMEAVPSPTHYYYSLKIEERLIIVSVGLPCCSSFYLH